LANKKLKRKKQKAIADEMIKLMEKGFKLGKIKIKSRAELYKR